MPAAAIKRQRPSFTWPPGPRLVAAKALRFSLGLSLARFWIFIASNVYEAMGLSTFGAGRSDPK
jgi:hypothetical protein